MKKKKQEKTKSQKRVLIVSIVLALLIVAGATFAWFTSKDEVTNKLSASSNYGVTIVEDFTPPSNWTPGQKVNKDVALVNTGNVDAIVRASLSSAISLTLEDAGVACETTITPVASGTQTTPTAVTLTNVTPVPLSKYTGSASEITDNGTASANEIKSIQAGGRLICEAGIILSEAETKDGTDYVPAWTGLYVFERSDEKGNKTYSGYYYVQPDGSAAYGSTPTPVPTTATNTNPTPDSATVDGAGTYYKIKNIVVTTQTPKIEAKIVTTKTIEFNDSQTVASGNGANLTITPVSKQTYTTIISNNGGKFEYDYSKITYDQTSNDTPYIILKYYECTGNSSYTDNPVVINIYLNPSWATYWTFDSDTNTFYYNYKLEAGSTSAKLVDSLELDKDVNNDAYISFDYSLNIMADSVQVVTNENGTESTTAADKSWTEAADYQATATLSTADSKTITSIVWAKKTNSN
jgi:predicted ribosomally synthesized peptide with SipW-like signal peptide